MRQQVHNFRNIDKNIKRLKIIQSNKINNNYNERDLIHLNKEETNNNNKRDIKARLFKFSQNFTSYHLSFVPISVKYNEHLLNINDNSFNRSDNFSKLTKNSSYTENFLKKKKSFFFINKRNTMNHIRRVNSDFAEDKKELTKLKNTFFEVKRLDKINNTDVKFF